MPRYLSQLLALALYLVGIVLFLTGAFLMQGWPVALMVAAVIAVLVGLILQD